MIHIPGERVLRASRAEIIRQLAHDNCVWQSAADVCESDRVVRLTRIQALAEHVFQDVYKANRWLRERLAILDGKCPLDVARTEAGARLIEQLLAKLDWGAAA